VIPIPTAIPTPTVTLIPTAIRTPTMVQTQIVARIPTTVPTPTVVQAQMVILVLIRIAILITADQLQVMVGLRQVPADQRQEPVALRQALADLIRELVVTLVDQSLELAHQVLQAHHLVIRQGLRQQRLLEVCNNHLVPI